MSPMPDMIVFGEDWGRHPSSTQHLMKQLALTNKIIWVNSLGLRRPKMNRADLDRLKQKALALVRYRSSENGRCAHPFTELVNPRTLPFPGSKTAALFNRYALKSQIVPLLNRHHFSQPLIWTSLPTALDVVGHLSERAVIYYAGDDFGALAGVDHGSVLAMESRLADKAALIIAASPEIAKRFPAGKTRILSHGVDYELFSKPCKRAFELDQESPVAGFYGSLNSWIDLDLIAATARNLPEWSFVLIGKVETDISTLKHISNIKFLGPRPHEELASFSQHWNVSLLPFKKNRQINASNPLKLREYLAAGKPVLASYQFPAAREFGEAIYCPHQDEDFTSALLRASADERNADYRQSLVKNQSWRSKSSQLATWLQEL